MKAASRPANTSRRGRLLVVTQRGIVHAARTALPLLFDRHDLIVANDAATLPASLHGVHLATGRAIEVRLAGRSSLDPGDVSRFRAIVFGEGSYRTPTEHRPLPPPLRPGDDLALGALRAHVVSDVGHPRLVELAFTGSRDRIWAGLARSGRPIQYAYVPEPLQVWDTWTRVAARPVAFEPPSAGFVLDWAMLPAIRRRGAQFATLTHAAGISSTGDPALDRLLPFDEPYDIPVSTASLVEQCRAAGGRILAVGTTVVRALEAASDGTGRVRSGAGLATNRLGPDTPLTVVDGIVSGMHEPGTSHYELLKAFADESVLARMSAEAEAGGYLAHEFGDFMFVEGRRSALRRPPPVTLRDAHLAGELGVVLEERLLA